MAAADTFLTIAPIILLVGIFLTFAFVELSGVMSSQKSWYEILVPNPGIKIRG